MQPVSFKRHRFPPNVVRLAVWLYSLFTLGFRDVEEMVVKIRGKRMRLWRAVDDGSANSSGSSLTVQRHLIGRSTLRLFRAEADQAWAAATALESDAAPQSREFAWPTDRSSHASSGWPT